MIPLAVGIYGIHEEIWICEIQLEICQISLVKVSWISEDWEIDWVYMGLRGLGALGLVWDIKVVTEEVLAARYQKDRRRKLGINRLYQLECAGSKAHRSKHAATWLLSIL